MSKIIEKIRIDSRSAKPIYQQIAEQLQQLIVTEQIRAGEHLPSIRHLGALLDISPNTVAKAYLELEQRQVVVAKRGGGTIVTSGMDDPAMQAIRKKHLLDNINEDIIKMLSQGYSPEEMEVAYLTSLERWREQRRIFKEMPGDTSSTEPRSKIIRIIGSNDIALNMLAAIFRQQVKDTEMNLADVGSVGGLIALGEGKAEIAGTHLLDEVTGEYNLPFIKRILPGREIVLVNLVYRIQGLMFAAGNPRQITGLTDLRKSGIVFVNRQKGSGTRVLLDMHLKRLGIAAHEIMGYDVELDNHLAVGLTITQGKADIGLGIEAAARSCGLDFLPLFRERYDLAIPAEIYRGELLTPLLKIIVSDEFKRIVNKVDGYDTSQTGKTTFVS